MKTVQPRKQRKMLFCAPLHARHSRFSAPLSPSLRTSRHIRTVPVRAGDTVRIVRGDRKGSEGKVTKIDHRKYRIFIEGITREKIDGTAIRVPIHPSKVVITNLNLDDKWRSEALKAKAPKEAEKPVEEEKKPKRERKKRRPRKAAKEKTEASRRRRKAKPAEEGKKGETEVG